MKITIFVTLLTSAISFSPVVKPKTSTFNFNGDIAPTGFFDPLRVTENSDERTLKYMREAELHHGRIAMVSSLILPTLDILNKDELAVNVLAKGGSKLIILVYFRWHYLNLHVWQDFIRIHLFEFLKLKIIFNLVN